jgi:hypothetical protein
MRREYSVHNSEHYLWSWRMASSGMLRRVNLLRSDVSEELSASFIKVTRIDISSQSASVASYSYRWF